MAWQICWPVALPPFAASAACTPAQLAALLRLPTFGRAVAPFLLSVKTVALCGVLWLATAAGATVGTATAFGFAIKYTPLGLVLGGATALPLTNKRIMGHAYVYVKHNRANIIYRFGLSLRVHMQKRYTTPLAY